MLKNSFIAQIERLKRRFGTSGTKYYTPETIDLMFEQLKFQDEIFFQTCIDKLLLACKSYPTLDDIQYIVKKEGELKKKKEIPQNGSWEDLASRTEASPEVKSLIALFIEGTKKGIHKHGYKQFCDDIADRIDAQLKKEGKAP